MKKRKELVRRFQEDEAVGFFVLSLKAGGAGLNLTAASHVVHFDRWWNPAVENQATDRAFRIGQTKNVLVHKFVCRGTVEEKIDQLIESKRQLSTDLLEGGADLLLTEMKDEELLKLVALDINKALKGDVIDGLLRLETLCFGGAAARQKPQREMAKLKKKGHPVSPVVMEGRTIVKTFWGKAWCENLERYSDYANRLPRGRTYVRNGSVIDLQIASGEIKALVSGSEIYEVAVKIAPVAKARWKSICTDCAGAIDSLVELLQGPFVQRRHGTGLPAEDRPVPIARRDPALVQLSGLGRHVQACGGGALRHRRPAGSTARPALPVAQRGREGTHRGRWKGPSAGEKGAGCHEGARWRGPLGSLWIGHGLRRKPRRRDAWRRRQEAEAREDR